MTKNTKAKITILFIINKKNPYLDQALDAIARQTDKNFNVIFVFNGAPTSEKDIFKNFDFRAINKVDYVFVSEDMGEGYACKYCYDFVQTKYVYYFDSNTIIHPDCVATLNLFIDEHPDADVINFYGVPNIYFKEPYMKVKTLADDFCYRPLVSLDNKVISLEYIIKHKISVPMFKHWSVYFYVQLIKGNPNWYSLGRRLCDSTRKPLYPFNIMDLYDQCEALVELMEQEPYNKHKSEIEYLCMVTLFRNFIYGYFNEYKGRFMQQMKILNKVEVFMNKNFPKWQHNEFLNEKINKNDKTYISYLREFKPKLFHTLRTVMSKDFLKGYGKKD